MSGEDSLALADTLEQIVFGSSPQTDKTNKISNYPVEPGMLPANRDLLPEFENSELRELHSNHVKSRITRNPRDLFSHVRRVLTHFESNDNSKCYGALIDLFVVLGTLGQDLRQSLLSQTKGLLSSEQVEFLQSHLDYSLESKDQIPDISTSLLAKGVSGETDIVVDGMHIDNEQNLAESASIAIEKGQDSAARIYLEQALQDDPGRGDVSMELLALYQRNNLREEFLNTWTKLSGRKLALVELWEKLENQFRSKQTTKDPQTTTQQKKETIVSEYHLLENYYLLPTAAGAFYAVSSAEPEPLRLLLLSFLKHSTTVKFDIEQLKVSIGAEDEQQVLELLHQAQTLSWIQGFKSPRSVPDLRIGEELENLLAPLSAIQKGLLVDWNGFAFARHGIDDETADTLSALSTDIAAVEKRHAERLKKTLGVASQGWAAVDAYGSSRIGAWPMFVGQHRFLLVLQGEPRLNQPEFITLTWILVNRYGSETNKD